MAESSQPQFENLKGLRTFKIIWFLCATIIWTLIDTFIVDRWFIHSRFIHHAYTVDDATIIFKGLLISFLLNIFLAFIVFYVIHFIKEGKFSFFNRLIKILLILVVIGWEYGLYYDIIFTKALIVLATYLLYQLGQKYTPGFFLSIMLGRYSSPRTEHRIIMFIDLKDSTPISEQLGHEKFFRFIRDFIFHVSNAALLNQGDIYQYVGDEVIVTWRKRKANNEKCLRTLVLSRRFLQANAKYFQKEYGVVPEFRVGIHIGAVTIGEIGVVKKELAMSGEAMNITARIRSSCSELNQLQIVSGDYFEFTNLKKWQGEDLGNIDLKGVENRNVRLYGLKI